VYPICTNTTAGAYRVLRGGDYYVGADLITTTCRNHDDPSTRKPVTGFRYVAFHMTRTAEVLPLWASPELISSGNLAPAGRVRSQVRPDRYLRKDNAIRGQAWCLRDRRRNASRTNWFRSPVGLPSSCAATHLDANDVIARHGN
jgi:hypothetical protein